MKKLLKEDDLMFTKGKSVACNSLVDAGSYTMQ